MSRGTQVRVVRGALRGQLAIALGPGPTPDTIAVRFAAAGGLLGVYAVTALVAEGTLAA